MALLLGGGILVSLILGYFAVSAVATLAHWVAVTAGLLGGAAVVYHLIDGDLSQYFDVLGFSSDLLELFSAGMIGAVTGFVAYVLIESVFVALGFTGALIVALLILASVLFGPGVVASALASFVGMVVEAVGGE